MSAPTAGFSSPENAGGPQSPQFSLVRPKTRFTRTLLKRNLLKDFLSNDNSTLFQLPQEQSVGFKEKCESYIESVRTTTRGFQNENVPPKCSSSRAVKMSTLRRSPSCAALSRSPLKVLQSCSPRAKSAMIKPAAQTRPKFRKTTNIAETEKGTGKNLPVEGKQSPDFFEESARVSPVTHPERSKSSVSPEIEKVNDLQTQPTLPPESCDESSQDYVLPSQEPSNSLKFPDNEKGKTVQVERKQSPDFFGESPNVSPRAHSQTSNSSMSPEIEKSNDLRARHIQTPDFFAESPDDPVLTSQEPGDSVNTFPENDKSTNLLVLRSSPNLEMPLCLPTSNPGNKGKGVSRPTRSCRQAARQISPVSDTIDDDEPQYGTYFGDKVFGSDASDGSADAYKPTESECSGNFTSCSSGSENEEVQQISSSTKQKSKRAPASKSAAPSGSTANKQKLMRAPASTSTAPSGSSTAPSGSTTTPSGSRATSGLTPSSAGSTARPERRKGTSKLVEENKKARNSGNEYETLTGKVVRSRELQPLTMCRMKCIERLIEEGRKEIFKEYWALNDFDKRVNYIVNHVFEDPKKTSRPRTGTRNRTCTLRYELEQNNCRVVVCKKCFLATLDENDGFVARALDNKKKSYSGVTAPDRRGRKPSARKTVQNVLESIRSHIDSFPHYESHYGRSQSEKKYLGADLSVSSMYSLYVKENRPKTSLSVYYREFKSTGLKFKPPAVDTCGKCDAYQQRLKHCTAEEKPAIQGELEAHHIKAQDAYAVKKADKEEAKEDPTKQVICFDLEQVLPCPLLSSGETFYKRQLSVYNLTVYNCSMQTGTNYMWSEIEAGRGANEISSCVVRYLKEEVAPPVTQVTMYSDTCSGQNKNSHMCAALISAVKDHPSLEIVDHKFLVPGHTFMECDQIHANIEKKKKKATVEIHHPNSWYDFIKTVPYKKSNLLVREMKQEHFFDFAALLQQKKDGPLVMREKNCDGDQFLFSPVQWFRFQKELPTTVLYKLDLAKDSAFKQLNFRRRGKLGKQVLQPKQCYEQSLPIKASPVIVAILVERYSSIWQREK
ncbi:hypothetical protein FOCC_FOCC006575 [Frankliniella occidentalis]|nr:hypothetical protein FOCC_FOCC006575 [Frankliniella occidentalis]